MHVSFTTCLPTSRLPLPAKVVEAACFTRPLADIQIDESRSQCDWCKVPVLGPALDPRVHDLQVSVDDMDVGLAVSHSHSSRLAIRMPFFWW